MRKFFKMGLICIMVLAILCSFVGCSQNKPSSDNSTTSSSGVGSDEGGIGDGEDIPDHNNNEPRKTDGKYEYDIAGNTITCEVNIDDYISESDGLKYFDFTRLIEDYGFTKNDLGLLAEKSIDGHAYELIDNDCSQVVIGGESRTECSSIKIRRDGELIANVMQAGNSKAEYLIIGNSGRAVSYEIAVLCAYAASSPSLEIDFVQLLPNNRGVIFDEKTGDTVIGCEIS